MAHREDNYTGYFKLPKDDIPKHSSGDLHSRLKTRKLLGVGETDDGDIHRSKLSQILGHSDQLYVKLPSGLRVWQLLMASLFTLLGLWALVFPSHIFSSTMDSSAQEVATLPIRLYGGAVISFSIVHWMTLRSQDRDVIRMSLLASVVFFLLQFVVTGTAAVFADSKQSSSIFYWVMSRGLCMLISLYYYWSLGHRKCVVLKKSASQPKLSI